MDQRLSDYADFGVFGRTSVVHRNTNTVGRHGPMTTAWCGEPRRASRIFEAAAAGETRCTLSLSRRIMIVHPYLSLIYGEQACDTDFCNLAATWLPATSRSRSTVFYRINTIKFVKYRLFFVFFHFYFRGRSCGASEVAEVVLGDTLSYPLGLATRSVEHLGGWRCASVG